MTAQPLHRYPERPLHAVPFAADESLSHPVEQVVSLAKSDPATHVERRQDFIPLTNDPANSRGLYGTLLAANESLSFPHNLGNSYRRTREDTLREIGGLLADVSFVLPTHAETTVSSNHLDLDTVSAAVKDASLIVTETFALLDGAKLSLLAERGLLHNPDVDSIPLPKTYHEIIVQHDRLRRRSKVILSTESADEEPLSIISPEGDEPDSLATIALNIEQGSLIPLPVNRHTVEEFAAGKTQPLAWIEIGEHDVFIHGLDVLFGGRDGRPQDKLPGVMVFTPEQPSWPAVVDPATISQGRQTLTSAYVDFASGNARTSTDREDNGDDNDTVQLAATQFIDDDEDDMPFTGGAGFPERSTAIHHVGMPLALPSSSWRRLPLPSIPRRRLR
jgi:hypothetical protein